MASIQTDASTPDTAGPYIIREIIRDIPLGEHEDGTRSRITSVDTWNGNLYIGTSAGEVLHYVSLPAETEAEGPTYIFATKLEPAYNTAQQGADQGVKQILLLPEVQKACVLCNGTLTFYTLPELSPAFGGKIKQPGCLWVGGTDLAELGQGTPSTSGTVIVICLKQRLRLIRIGDEARKIRDIELGGIQALVRREDLACVADGTSYSLLDVVNQRKNELFPISSQIEPPPAVEEPEAPKSREASRSFSSRSPVRLGRGHERNISLGADPRANDRLRPDSSSPWPTRRSSRQTESPEKDDSRVASPAPGSGEASGRTSVDAPTEPASSEKLPPNIVSPTPNEFLLTTGTQLDEAGVGMFVNSDGDVVRGTIEFETYPTSLVLDGGMETSVDGLPDDASQQGYVLAVVKRMMSGKSVSAVEVQRWDVDPSEQQASKSWIPLLDGENQKDDEPGATSLVAGVGLRRATTATSLAMSDISDSLRLRRLPLSGPVPEPNEAELKRNNEEDALATRLALARASVLLHCQDRVSWLVRNALILQLEARLNTAVQQNLKENRLSVDVPGVQRVVNGIRRQDAMNELDFITLTYVRQKASLLLFGHLVLQTAAGTISYERDKRFAEEALIAGEIDPRVIVSLVPPLTEEVQEGGEGLWAAQGLRSTLEQLRASYDFSGITQDPKGAYGDNLLHLVKRYLMVWRKKKGFGSVADEANVFRTVDAALLRVLLMLDANSPRGPATAGSVRAELNDVVDRGVDCFDRAIELFEQHQRLYVLSRLYQSRKMTAQVLATWRRILEGEKDAGGELIEGEHDIRRYLAKLRDASLVQEYGAWLANRNPKLGVQVFADDSSRVKFEPQEAVTILKVKAPGAVKDYLEHLVFGKNHVQYVNDLIAFYLDTVLSELEKSEEAKHTLLQSYETYRALRPPKPTYRQFITENAVDAEWWHNRLRLLQLIGGSHGAASRYDVHALGTRLAPYSDELVPEMIILNGREGKHQEALRLLTHGLGDYDTAIRYCLLGGLSIFHPGSGLAPEQPVPSKDEQAGLFETLLDEFFKIQDLSERLERTSELLERFGGWFDVGKVLELIPEDWSVELVSGFLVHAFRRLVREKNETVVVKALSSAQNLRQAVQFIEKTESLPPMIVRTDAPEPGIRQSADPQTDAFPRTVIRLDLKPVLRDHCRSRKRASGSKARKNAGSSKADLPKGSANLVHSVRATYMTSVSLDHLFSARR